MDEQDWLAERFEDHRAQLRAVAYRMLGSLSEADDAVQEAWLRLSRSEAERRSRTSRLADHGRRAGVAEHAALAQDAPRGADRISVPDPIVTARTGWTRARGAPGRLGRAGAARRARDALARRAARVRAARHVRRAVREIAPIVDRSPTRRASSPAVRGAGCRASARCRIPISTAARGRRRVPRRRARGRLRGARRGARSGRRAARRLRRAAASAEVRGAEAVAGRARSSRGSAS